MRGHAAEHGQDGLREVHAFDVLGRGLLADQNDLFLVLAMLRSFVSGEVDSAGAGAGGSGQALGNDGSGLQGGSVKVGVQQAVQLLGFYLQDGFLLGQHAFVHQVDSDLQGSRGGTLAVTGLQHVELAFLDGVFHILHVAVVSFQLAGDVHKLLVHIRHLILQLGDGAGGTDTGNHVFALSVQQIFAVQLLFAGGGVTGESNASTGGLAHVAEHHALHVNGSAPVAGDVVHAAVVDGAGVVPAAEHGLDGFHQLNLGILREVHAHGFLVDALKALHNGHQVFGGQVTVELDALLLLELVQHSLELALRDLHHHVGEHGDEAAIRVIREVGVVGLLGQALDGHVGQAQVQDGIHHAGHGSAGAGTHGDQEGVFFVAEFLAGDFFGLSQSGIDLLNDFIVDLLAVGVVTGAGLGGHGEALRHRQTQIGHFGQVRALAAQKFAHVRVAFFEQVHILCHCVSFPPYIDRGRITGGTIPQCSSFHQPI